MKNGTKREISLTSWWSSALDASSKHNGTYGPDEDEGAQQVVDAAVVVGSGELMASHVAIAYDRGLVRLISVSPDGVAKAVDDWRHV